jgi:Amt family ammonium transporter
VTPEEEMEGLDIGEHGNRAYPDFATHDTTFTGVAAMSAVSPSALATPKPAVAKP